MRHPVVHPLIIMGSRLVMDPLVVFRRSGYDMRLWTTSFCDICNPSDNLSTRPRTLPLAANSLKWCIQRLQRQVTREPNHSLNSRVLCYNLGYVPWYLFIPMIEPGFFFSLAMPWSSWIFRVQKDTLNLFWLWCVVASFQTWDWFPLNVGTFGP